MTHQVVRQGGAKHFHKYFVDADSPTGEAFCLCGRPQNQAKGAPRKYHNVTSIYNGYPYDSKLEAREAMELDYRKKAGLIKDWVRQYRIRVDLGEYHLFNMKVDFMVSHNDETFELRETKGYATDIFRLKLKLIEAIWLPANPLFRYTLVK